MIRSNAFKQILLFIHVSSSIGWFGAVVCFCVLAIAGMIQMQGSVYHSLEIITNLVILPFSLFSLGSGVILALATDWGLFRHYWILIKFVFILISTIVLFIHLNPIEYMAQFANVPLTNAVHGIQLHLVIASGAAILVLGLVTILSIVKPSGLTPYGWRKLRK